MDREKVKAELDEIVEQCRGMDYIGFSTITEHCQNILSMLKEQEAVEPKVEKAILDYQSWHYICGDCGGQIDINDNYCKHCGRVVAHLSNKI